MLSREQINDVGGDDNDDDGGDDVDDGDQYITSPGEDKPYRRRNMNRKRKTGHRNIAMLMKTWMRKVLLYMRRNNSIM